MCSMTAVKAGVTSLLSSQLSFMRELTAAGAVALIFNLFSNSELNSPLPPKIILLIRVEPVVGLMRAILKCKRHF